MTAIHPAFERMLLSDEGERLPNDGSLKAALSPEHTTSLSLARFLAAGCLARLNPGLSSVSVWDPAVGSGFAGHLLVEALMSVGVEVSFRGQDIDRSAVAAARDRFADIPDAEVAVGNSLLRDESGYFTADLVIVDGPSGMNWADAAAAVESRRSTGSFRFGLPQRTDSSWLFISLALEKLRAPSEGGGRVAALVDPKALRARGASAAVRRRVLEAGLLESVTRLPEGLAPNMSISQYLLTFSNRNSGAARRNAMVADFQTQFTTEQQHRRALKSAILDLESALRTGRPGPRNRSVPLQKFLRREARLTRSTRNGRDLSWRITTFGDTAIDSRCLEARYGLNSGVSVSEDPSEIYDLDPGRILQDDSQALLTDIESRGWQALRLSGLLETEPVRVINPSTDVDEDQLFVPTTRGGRASAGVPDGDATGRVLAFEVDRDRLDPKFLAGWLNSDQGIMSRRNAIEASSSGQHFEALRSDPNSLMRWADELIVPVPGAETQRYLADADERLTSFQQELSSQRERIWTSREDAESAVERFAKVFDDSIVGWLEDLPFPVASALWTAETAQSTGDRLQAYLHAWEALVAFHATVLLSACRTDPGSSVDVESAIRRTLNKHGIGIERPSLATWIVITESTSKSLRNALLGDDADEAARVRATFSGLAEPAIERLLDKGVGRKFHEVRDKRNRWHGHSGHVSEDERRERVDSLVSDVRDLRRILGNVWSQFPLVRAGRSRRVKDGYIQEAEVAVGTRSPFISKDFHVGDAMLDGELYLVRDGSPSPLRLGQFVQLRAAPRDAQYTSYFYNRTEGSSIRMVSYQYGPESEVEDDAERFRDEFGALRLERH